MSHEAIDTRRLLFAVFHSISPIRKPEDCESPPTEYFKRVPLSVRSLLRYPVPWTFHGNWKVRRSLPEPLSSIA